MGAVKNQLTDYDMKIVKLDSNLTVVWDTEINGLAGLEDQANAIQLDASGNASIVAGDVDGGTTDACSAVTLAVDLSSFTCADAGMNTVTLTGTDAAGNIASCQTTVDVLDTIVRLPVTGAVIPNFRGVVQLNPGLPQPLE